MNGKFSDPQRDLYNAVLNVHRSCVSLCREDAGLSLDRLHNVAETGLRDQLIQLGFDVSGGVGLSVFFSGFSSTDHDQAMGILFPHHLGHYIGLDVHDCSGYSRGYNLKAGQCITIEPYVLMTICDVDHANNRGSGIYVPDDERWPAQFRGIGIRIEDSVCVGDDSPIVLTTEAVKEVSDLSRVVGQRKDVLPTRL